MEVRRRYPSQFTAFVLKQAYDEFLSKFGRWRNIGNISRLQITVGRDTITFESLEEFLRELPRADSYEFWHHAQGSSLSVCGYDSNSTSVSVKLQQKHDIESILKIFDQNQSRQDQEQAPPQPGHVSKTKYYYRTRFANTVIREARDKFLSSIQRTASLQTIVTVQVGQETWEYGNVEELFAELPNSSSFRLDDMANDRRFIADYDSLHRTYVSVRLPTRQQVQAVFEILDRNASDSIVQVESDPITVFIGHGRSPHWRDLKDHLHDMHGINVVAYEIGPRAGLSVKEILQNMLSQSSFALLVLTGEDIHSDGELHARENVVHELGLFQGKLGFTRAIALLEDDVKEFSNILGINQVRFSKGKIRETFGDVLATIRREFDKPT